MSTTPPPDRPTERLQPTPPPVYEQRGAAPAADAIGPLRTGLTIVGVIAVAALAVAVYALVQANDSSSGSRSGLATDSRVSQLDDRVDRLSRQVQELRSGGGGSSGGGDSAALDDRIAALERTVKTLASRPATDPTQAIEELSGRLDAVSRDVEELKQTPPAP